MNQYFTNNPLLKSKLKKIDYNYLNTNFTFFSDQGVFSKNYIDYGSKFLAETLLLSKNNYRKILDVGCGYGFIGIVLSKIMDSQVSMIDVNERAVHLCQKNIKENNINGESFISNSYEKINDNYDLIITNPPIRAGKKTVLNILINAKNFLTDKGELWFVINKNQGAKSIEKIMIEHYNIKLIAKAKSFYVFCAKKS